MLSQSQGAEQHWRCCALSPGKRSYCCIINVSHIAWAIIEKLVAAGIVALEVFFPERYAVRPLRILKNLHSVALCMASLLCGNHELVLMGNPGVTTTTRRQRALSAVRSAADAELNRFGVNGMAPADSKMPPRIALLRRLALCFVVSLILADGFKLQQALTLSAMLIPDCP